ncbi:Uncharacterised protein [Escherichia coli]|nr:Uncharacterised protein [Escherichia coli]
MPKRVIMSRAMSVARARSSAAPGRQLAEHQLFGGTPAQQYGDLVLEIGTRHQEAVFGGALQGVAQRADAARDDRDLVYGVGFGQRQRHQRMAHLVMGHGFPLLGIEHAALLFQARHDALDGRGEVLQFHGGRTASPRRQRRLVDPIGEVRAGKARWSVLLPVRGLHPGPASPS